MASKRHLRLVKDRIKPEEVTLDTTAFEAIPDEDELEYLLDEVSDEDFGTPNLKDAKPVKLKDWKAEEFASIYVRFRPHLERHAKRFIQNRSQIDEVVQDAFLYLMVSLPELDSEIGVLKFLKWKVKNLCIDIYRAQGRAYVNNIDDISEPASNDPELGHNIEQAEDAAVVKLALSKLNPRHREVLLASIYEQKSTAEIAAQVGLSENATLQLLHRARGAFKKALLGDTNTEGMSMAAILSVAARKAGEDAKKLGAQAMVLVLLLAVGIGAIFTSNRASDTNTVAGEETSTKPVVENPVTPVTQPEVIKATTASVKFKDVDPVDNPYQVYDISTATADKIVAASDAADVVVYRASYQATDDYILEANNGVRATFHFADNQITNLEFSIWADGVIYKAYPQNVQQQLQDGKVYLTATLTDLIDVNGLVYGNNALARALVQLHFTPGSVPIEGHLAIFAKK